MMVQNSTGAFSTQEHRFLDHETVLAVDRANQKKLGGRSDWTAPELQAAAWIAAKGKGLLRRIQKSIIIICKRQ